MRFVDRAAFPAPPSWTRVSGDSRYRCYHDLDATEEGQQARADLRAHMTQAQRGLCAYCCCEITGDAGDTHNEHIAPESKFEKRSLDYGNLVASCNRQTSCGNYKGSDFDEPSFVSPLQPDCERHFRYLPNGTLEGTTGEGEATVEALNLNDYDLLNARKALVMSLLWADVGYVRSHCREHPDGRLRNFADMLDQFCDDGVFGAGGGEGGF